MDNPALHSMGMLVRNLFRRLDPPVQLNPACERSVEPHHGITYQKKIQKEQMIGCVNPDISLACLNVHGCNQEIKKVTTGEIMNRRKLDLFTLSETKQKEKGKIACRNVEGLRSGVNE